MKRCEKTAVKRGTGPVLSGSAGRHAEIHLHLYTDDLKALELFLLNQGVQFRVREMRLWSGDSSVVAPTFWFSSQDADFAMTVLPSQHRRQPLRVSQEGRPLDRAPIESVAALVASEE